jgi:TRAP-type uncharacterized transport system substrate-binding protein
MKTLRLRAIHPAAQGIAYPIEFQDAPAGFKWHVGAELYRKNRNGQLAIITGPVDGHYYRLGKILQDVLSSRGIDALLIATEGSVDNLQLLSQDRPAIAFLQYDVALASLSYAPKAVYRTQFTTFPTGESDKFEIAAVHPLYRIASLHEEVLYVLANKAAVTSRFPPLRDPVNPQKDAPFSTPWPLSKWTDFKNLKIGLGSIGSGSHPLARAVLGGKLLSISERNIESIEYMVRNLQLGNLDVGFVVASPKTNVVNDLLYDDRIVPVSIDDETISRLRGTALERSHQANIPGTMEPRKYDVNTLKTRAILVSNGHVPAEIVKKVTNAVIDSADLLADERGDSDAHLRDLAIQCRGIPLHPMAEAVFKERDILPSEKVSWISWSNGLLAFFLAAFTTGGLIAGVWPRIVTSRVARDIAAIGTEDANGSRGINTGPVDVGQNGAVTTNGIAQLRAYREKLRKASSAAYFSKKSWEDLNHRLPPAKWREADLLIERRIAAARESRTRSFAKEIHELSSAGMEGGTKIQCGYDLARELWSALVNGELDSRQYEFLQNLLSSALEVQKLGESRSEQQEEVGQRVYQFLQNLLSSELQAQKLGKSRSEPQSEVGHQVDELSNGNVAT